MRHRRQRGMTLVELLVAMAVMSILLVGLDSAVFSVSSRYQDLAHRLQTATVGVSLAARLQSDSHRYVLCDLTQLRQPLSDLALCSPDDFRDAVVTYHVVGTGPWTITREQGGRAAFLVRSDTQPTLWIDCVPGTGTVSGHIHVYNLRLPSDSLDPTSRETFSVYYVAPWGTRGC